MPAGSSWKSRGLLLVSSLLVTVVLVEILLRLAGTGMPPPPLYPGDREAVRDRTWDAHVGWKLPPNANPGETTADYSITYRSNRLGFRGDDDALGSPATERIVFLGDSFTFGSGVPIEDTFAARVAAERPNAVGFNLGIGGFGIDQMWLTLAHHGLALEPTRVVLSFIRNDLDRSLSAYRLGHVWLEKPLFFLEGGKLVQMTVDNRPGPVASWIRQDTKWAGLFRRVEHSVSRNFAFGPRWHLNRALFEAVRDTCLAASVPLLVVHLPVNRRHEAPMLAREFESMEIPFLDLTSALPVDADSLYFPNDHHFNAAGHEFAAGAILAAIE